MYWEYIYAAASLTIVSVLLLAALYGIRYKTVRIYNWNGKRTVISGARGLEEAAADIRCGLGSAWRIYLIRHYIRSVRRSVSCEGTDIGMWRS